MDRIGPWNGARVTIPRGAAPMGEDGLALAGPLSQNSARPAYAECGLIG